ncbi:MAG: DNA repair ATPase RecN [Alphaproteobacteria bacterium]|jgi:DNA repair ATPase RecN
MQITPQKARTAQELTTLQGTGRVKKRISNIEALKKQISELKKNNPKSSQIIRLERDLQKIQKQQSNPQDSDSQNAALNEDVDKPKQDPEIKDHTLKRAAIAGFKFFSAIVNPRPI